MKEYDREEIITTQYNKKDNLKKKIRKINEIIELKKIKKKKRNNERIITESKTFLILRTLSPQCNK